MHAGVIRIETESDIERLRQVALLQQAELQRLSKRLVELTSALAEARGEDAILALQQELAFLKEELAVKRQELFGASSERLKSENHHERVNPSETETRPIPSNSLEFPWKVGTFAVFHHLIPKLDGVGSIPVARPLGSSRRIRRFRRFIALTGLDVDSPRLDVRRE